MKKVYIKPHLRIVVEELKSNLLDNSVVIDPGIGSDDGWVKEEMDDEGSAWGNSSPGHVNWENVW